MKRAGNYIADLQRFFRIPIHPGSGAATRILLSKLPMSQASLVCDIGCGTGTTLDRIAREYACQCIGVDRSYGALRRCSPNRIRRINAGGGALPCRDAVFDVVLIESVLVHAGMESIVREAVRVTKTGGWLGINDSFLRRAQRERAEHVLGEIASRSRVPMPTPMTLDECCRLLEELGATVNSIIDTPCLSHELIAHRYYSRLIDWKYRIGRDHSPREVLSDKIIIARKTG